MCVVNLNLTRVVSIHTTHVGTLHTLVITSYTCCTSTLVVRDILLALKTTLFTRIEN